MTDTKEQGKPIHNWMSSIEQGSQHILILIKNLMLRVSMTMV